jgi:ribosomal protein L12E/L44/L45/RPP1/RPP2
MTMGFDDDGDPRTGRTEEAVETEEDGMDVEESTEEFVRNLEKNSVSLLQKEAERSARTSASTSTSTTTTTTGMKKIDDEEEEEKEEEELGMKTRNWRKINLSFAIELGED